MSNWSTGQRAFVVVIGFLAFIIIFGYLIKQLALLDADSQAEQVLREGAERCIRNQGCFLPPSNKRYLFFVDKGSNGSFILRASPVITTGLSRTGNYTMLVRLNVGDRSVGPITKTLNNPD